MLSGPASSPVVLTLDRRTGHAGLAGNVDCTGAHPSLPQPSRSELLSTTGAVWPAGALRLADLSLLDSRLSHNAEASYSHPTPGSCSWGRQRYALAAR